MTIIKNKSFHIRNLFRNRFEILLKKNKYLNYPKNKSNLCSSQTIISFCLKFYSALFIIILSFRQILSQIPLIDYLQSIKDF